MNKAKASHAGGYMKPLNQELVDMDYLNERKRRLTARGFPVSRWIVLVESLMALGLQVTVYEPPTTHSKYIRAYVHLEGPCFKIRVSDHKPVFAKEALGDCDFFVGVTNLGVTSIRDAEQAVIRHFNIQPSNGGRS